MKKNSNTKRGFTIAELVLVIAIVGVLAIAVGTIMIDSQKTHIGIAAKKVKSDIDHARSWAMAKRGTTYGVYFDDSNDQYTVYENTVGTPVLNPQTRQNMVQDFSQFPNISITGGDYTVEFGQFGNPTTGGGGSVQITDGSTTKTISVTAGTGRVNVN